MPGSTPPPAQTPPSNLRPMRPVQRTAFDEQILPVQTEAATQNQPIKPDNGRDSCAYKCAMKFLGPWEGGYVNDPNDAGGATNRGVTHTVYDSYRKEKGLPTQDVQQMTDAEHDDIYFDKYWTPSHAADLPPKLAISQFDWAVNHGIGGATKTLQESVGLTGKDVDGQWGAGSQAALDTKLAEPNGADTVVGTYLDNRAAWYKDRAAANPSQAKFLNGWLNRVDSPPDKTGRQGIRTYLNDMDNQCPGCTDPPAVNLTSPPALPNVQSSPTDTLRLPNLSVPSLTTPLDSLTTPLDSLGLPSLSMPTPIAAASNALTNGLTGDSAIDALNLEPDVAQKALELKQNAPGVVFNSGRRALSDQARAMAGNLVSDRDWMANTYKASDTKVALQQWLDDNPKAVTKSAISDGLNSVFQSLPADQVSKFSHHLSGRAFDIQPDSAPESVVRALDPLNFFTQEGGKKIWHVDF